MSNKITSSFRGKSGKILLSLLVLVLLITVSRHLFFNSSPPTLEDVLSRQHAGESSDPKNLSVIIASLVALSLTALSLAKSYEIVKRKKACPEMILPEVKDEPMPVDLGEDREIEELSQIKETLMLQNGELQTQLRISACEIEELKRIEQMLRKSNISLGKACERLKAENEDLVLKANTIKIAKPKKVVKVATARVLRKKKTKTRAKIRKKKGK
ncbi:MAG: hypothetical protein U9R38_07120 [Candidatus Margulisiibacteriota bacterium]|nr:hypothetical protein [Candidatus Margulisiibacteriota bacterium]